MGELIEYLKYMTNLQNMRNQLTYKIIIIIWDNVAIVVEKETNELSNFRKIIPGNIDKYPLGKKEPLWVKNKFSE